MCSILEKMNLYNNIKIDIIINIMEDSNNKYKTKLCNNYKKFKKCPKGDECLYAHGEEELRKTSKKCINGLKCFNKDCSFIHPSNWNYINNIKKCIYYKNGECVNDECNFIHDLERNKTNEHIQENDPNITIPINGYDYKFKNEDKILDKKHEKNDKIEELNNFNKLTNNLCFELEKNILDFKKELDELNRPENKEIIYNLKLQLNSLLSEVILFKYNINDIN